MPKKPDNKNSTDNQAYAKAYNIILSDPTLIDAEKVLLFEVCRYYPQCCFASNSELAKNTGHSIRYIEKLIAKLKQKKIIKAGYAHRKIIEKAKSYRVLIAPILKNWTCPDLRKLPNHSTVLSNKNKPQTTEPQGGTSKNSQLPNHSTVLQNKLPNHRGASTEPQYGQTTEPQGDLLDIREKNRYNAPATKAKALSPVLFKKNATTKTTRQNPNKTRHKQRPNKTITDPKRLERIEKQKDKLLKQLENVLKEKEK
jgi:hypothetical protein